MRPDALRGEVWLADLSPITGHEPAGRRPILIVSDNRLNRGRADVVFGVPLTTRDRGIPSHITVPRPDGGLRATSYAMCEHMRSISRTRLVERWGAVGVEVTSAVEDILRMLLGL
jgi:mRNA interferase MazF